MKETTYNDSFEEKQGKTDFRAAFLKYMARWPWFVASVIICLAGGWFYLRYTTPVYNINASIIIKDNKKGENPGTNLSTLEGLGIISSSKSIESEIEILHSKSLIKNVVSELGLYINYFAKGSLSKVEVYGTSPVTVYFAPQDADRLSSPLSLALDYRAGGKLDVSTTINGKAIDKHFDKLPAVMSSEAGTLTFMLNQQSSNKGSCSLKVVIQRPINVTKAYLEALTIEPTSKTSPVATISFQNTNPKRGEDFINKLIEMCNRDANDDKNKIAENTAHFIDERIAVINQELGSTEEELESFKRTSGLTNISSDAQLAVSERSTYDKLCVENSTQLNLVQYLADYLDTPENAYATLPANVGLNDNTLIALITQYNVLILERNRLLRTSSDANPVIQRLNSDIQNMRTNLATAITSVRSGLLITKTNLDRQASKYAGRISNAPAQERRYVSIQRQQEIKAGLYLMLLQKREENNITLAATANNAKIIDDALADELPVSPKKMMIYLVAFIMGIGIPVSIVYVQGLLSFRIEGRTDMEKLTAMPVIGTVPLAETAIAVHENDNNLMTETFRDLRTNLLFMLGAPDKKVILVTSTTSGEGKTFIASNLAVSLSLLDKKVIIVGLDIRKLGLNKVFHISPKEKGITRYLSAPQSTKLRSLIHPSGITTNLDLLPSGAIPPNPTELLARPALADAIEQLKQEYDYIVLDTATSGWLPTRKS